MAYVIVFVLLVAVVLVIASPLRRGTGPANTAVGDETGTELPSVTEQERIELEAAREAKLREIRDAELDHQTGKLSDQDFQAIDSQLRGEAIAIIAKIDELDGIATSEPEESVGADPAVGESPTADDRSAE